MYRQGQHSVSDTTPMDPTVEGTIHKIGNNEIQVARHGDVEVLAVRGAQDAGLMQAIENIAKRCSHDIGLDLRELRDMAPTILPLLRRLNRRFEEKQRVLLLYDPPSRLLDLLNLSNCADDFNIYNPTGGLSKRQAPAAPPSQMPQRPANPTRTGSSTHAVSATNSLGHPQLHPQTPARSTAPAPTPSLGVTDIDAASDTIVRFTQDLQRTQQLESSLEVAGMRAGRMIQKDNPEFPGYEIATAYLPHDKIGGDFFQFIPLDDNHLGVVIGDVSGHGIEAALLMGMTRKVLEIRAQDARLHNGDFDPANALMQTNRDLFADLDRFTFVTAFYGVLDRESGTFRYGRAGHNYPILHSACNHRAVPLDASGIAFGIDSGDLFDASMRTQVSHVQAGDSLVLYTDGVIEATHPQRGQYGMERLIEFLERSKPDLSALELKDAVIAEVEEFLEGTPLQDDLSLICIRRNVR